MSMPNENEAATAPGVGPAGGEPVDGASSAEAGPEPGEADFDAAEADVEAHIFEDDEDEGPTLDANAVCI